MDKNEIPLRYGMNPHQAPARVHVDSGTLPIDVLNGSPGYINLLDAVNGWQLVRELREALSLPAAASFKHVSPAGAGVAAPLDEAAQRAYFVDGSDLSPLATAYARARGADRVSSFGDFAALSDIVDVPTAQLLRREVSDGVIAPGFEPEALDILSRKKKGDYLVIKIDPDYQPPASERRQVYGLTFEQTRGDRKITPADLADVVTQRKDLPAEAVRDLLVAMIGIKYTQSNSVAYALDGQLIGVGAGQQSRIHCTRLAGTKADQWHLRRHPSVVALPFLPNLGRPERDNAIDQYLLGELAHDGAWRGVFSQPTAALTADEKRGWIAQMSGVSLASDGFIPFRDNIDRAARSGVKYIAQPGKSLRDADVISACDEHGIAMAFTGLRLFHH